MDENITGQVLHYIAVESRKGSIESSQMAGEAVCGTKIGTAGHGLLGKAGLSQEVNFTAILDYLKRGVKIAFARGIRVEAAVRRSCVLQPEVPIVLGSRVGAESTRS